MHRKFFTVFCLMGVLLGSVGLASAHANLARSEPPANSILFEAPAEIRLYFTEPLESGFSSIQLRDATGIPLELAPAEIDPDDPLQMVLKPGELPDGLYTVAWRALSSTDGHLTQSSFPLVIGAAAGQGGLVALIEESVPAESTLVRWLNLFSIALVAGSIAFVLLVWRGAVLEGQPHIEQRMRWLIWLSWWFLGVTTALVLLLQVAIVTEASIVAAATDFVQIERMLATRFGELWLLRLGAWGLVGAALLFARRTVGAYWLALLACAVLMLAQSLFSHASGTEDAFPAVLADWLHLAAMSLWIGGLVQFVNVIGPARRLLDPAAQTIGRLVGYFSNLARAAVGLLVVTGFYSGWLQVGSLDALLTTLYGQALLIKLVLMLPLLGIAAVNLVFTQQRLLSGETIWIDRLRRLVGVEIALTVLILGAVGVMTAVSPARSTAAMRAALPDFTPPSPIVETYATADLQADLEITPGLVGENTFTLTLAASDGTPIEDASLIRLRFDHQTERLGTSELRPEPVGGGQYRISGANLSVAGEWRIRATVQRPGEFDSVIDYHPLLEVFTPPPPPPVIDTRIPVDHRLLALLGLGVLCIGLGALLKEEKLLTTLIMTAGAIFLVSTIPLAQVGETNGVHAGDSFIAAPASPVRLAISSTMDMPLLVTAQGTLLQPDGQGQWQPFMLDALVQDVYVEASSTLWVVADDGVYRYKQGEPWLHIHDMPGRRVVMTHGFLYAIGDEGITRFHEQGGELLEREINLPQPEAWPDDFVMLGNHTHVLLMGGAVFQSIDLGLSWEPLDAPAPIHRIGLDPDGELLAATDDHLLRWGRANRGWQTLLLLPEGQPIEAIQPFNGRIYIAAGGRLYTPGWENWNAVNLPEAGDAYITALADQYPDRLWALDAAESRLFSTQDGQTWEVQPISTG